MGPPGAVTLQAPVSAVDQPPALALVALDVQEGPAVASEADAPRVAVIVGGARWPALNCRNRSRIIAPGDREVEFLERHAGQRASCRSLADAQKASELEQGGRLVVPKPPGAESCRGGARSRGLDSWSYSQAKCHQKGEVQQLCGGAGRAQRTADMRDSVGQGAAAEFRAHPLRGRAPISSEPDITSRYRLVGFHQSGPVPHGWRNSRT